MAYVLEVEGEAVEEIQRCPGVGGGQRSGLVKVNIEA
jgi:hypothetical protein